MMYVPSWKLYVWWMCKFQPPISDDVMSKLLIVVEWVSQNTLLQPTYS